MMLTGLLMVIMLVSVALVIDIAHAQLVQRQLQAGVDAAALAGAQDLPASADAEATAMQYSPTPGSKNSVNTVDNATTSAEAQCITTIPGCNTRYATANALAVQATAKVPTFFARLIGVDDLTVKARATACYPCAVRPLDIMIVLDRTGSMCDGDHDDRYATPPRCTELGAARDGVLTFISMMDPKLDRVGLAVLPPATGPAAGHGDGPRDACARPVDTDKWFGYDAWFPWWATSDSTGYRGQDRAFYVVSSLTDDDVDNDPTDDYVIQDDDGNWDLNPASGLVQTVNCVKPNGSTSYSMALADAEHELQTHGRAGVQDVIVFFTDGGANVTQDTGNDPTWGWNDGSTYMSRPCGAGVEVSNRLPADTAVYTIGYGLDDQEDPKQRCNQPDSNGHSNFGNHKEVCQTWGCSPEAALKAIASSPPDSDNANFYYAARPGDIEALFRRVAGDVLTNNARLVDTDQPNLTG